MDSDSKSEIVNLLKELIELVKQQNDKLSELMTDFLDPIRDEIEEIKMSIVKDY